MRQRLPILALVVSVGGIAGCAPGPDGTPDTSQPESTTTTPTPPVTVSDQLPDRATLEVGPNGIEYRLGDIDGEALGPSVLTVDAAGVSIADPVGGRVLRFDGTEWKTVIDLVASDLRNVSFLASTNGLYVVVEITFSPVRNRIHLVDIESGEFIQSSDIPVGFRLEDGLSGLLVGGRDAIYLEFEGGARFAEWQSGSDTFEATDAAAIGGHAVIASPPNLMIDGAIIPADLNGSLGGLRYLGPDGAGGHVVLREEVMELNPIVSVRTTVEWYASDLHHTGTAEIPSITDQAIPVAPAISVAPNGSVWVMTTTAGHVVVSRVNPRVDLAQT
jgi:hypothetical protein